MFGERVMNDLERIMDLHPELKFYRIYVKSTHYHGHIVGHDVYINAYQPDIDWLITALHEVQHYENDDGNCTNINLRKGLLAEKWATIGAKAIFKQMFPSIKRK